MAGFSAREMQCGSMPRRVTTAASFAMVAMVAAGVWSWPGSAAAQPAGGDGDRPAPAGSEDKAGEPVVVLPTAPAARSSAPVTSPTRALVMHLPPSTAAMASELRITALVDAAWTEAALILRYRRAGSADEFARLLFERSSAGGYFVTVPAEEVDRPGVEYYIAGETMSGTERVHFASSDAPHRVLVSPSRAVRWAEKERRRLGGYTSTVSADVWGHDFGNRFGNDDQYVRGHLDWTHYLLTRLYAISVGYGFIEGKTPDSSGSMAMSEKQGARYGYGRVRLMIDRAVWLDGGAMLGVSREGFIVGGRAELTLGRPWRSNVSVGGEYLEELGPSGWVRLQWDSVPPFLMGAAIVATDLPGATLSDGAFIVWDVSYPILSRVMLRGSLSFGSRDGPGHFGGGLGTSFAF